MAVNGWALMSEVYDVHAIGSKSNKTGGQHSAGRFTVYTT